jgi:uncharacterized protein YcfL
MKRIFFPGLVVASLALLHLGCQSPETGALPPQNTTRFDTELKEKFVLMDSDTQHSITCMGLKVTPLSDGRLQVEALVRNRENRRLQVQIQCEFTDALGFALDSTPWENLILTENSIENKLFVSANDKAKLYTIRVRQAR